MKTKTLLPSLPTLFFFTPGHAQTLDKTKPDQLFDRLAEPNKAMGSLTIAPDGHALYTRSSDDDSKTGSRSTVFTKEK